MFVYTLNNKQYNFFENLLAALRFAPTKLNYFTKKTKRTLSLAKKTLDTIKLTNIRAYSFHGCLTEEGKIGSDYRIDLSVKADLNKSAKSDQLTDTVDYVHLNQIVKEEMSVPSKLLEQVVDRILNRILKELSMVQKATVKVSKVNPPLGGDVERVSVKSSRKRNTSKLVK